MCINCICPSKKVSKIPLKKLQENCRYLGQNTFIFNESEVIFIFFFKIPEVNSALKIC